MINHIKIKNFRSLDVDVKLEPVTVLVGRSGTGKSNFVDAIRVLRDRLNSPHLPFNNSNIQPITCKDNSLLEYEISFDVSHLQGVFTYLVKFNFDALVYEEKLSFENETLFHYDKGRWIVCPNIISANYQLRDMTGLTSIHGMQKISIAAVALSEGIGCYDFPENVCREYTSNQDTTNGLLDDGKNTNVIFGKIKHDLTRLSSWNHINESMRFLNDSIQTIDQQSDRFGNILVTHSFGDNSIVLELARESEGCRRFFAYMLAFNQSPPKQTMIFEEPEKGLYPAAFAAFAQEMKNCPKSGQGQIILTTHSPDLLNSFEPESLRVVVMENGTTRIGLVSQDQMQSLRDYLLKPGELLTVDDARIDSPIISPAFLEGQTV
ncbi:MAG: ATP-binding protein [Planctomycetaceae bacterium]|jgi:AAA15 family ATPase/GTPase|nr:ATP-binding protein [Planctomycetaceae bacterium]